MPPLRHMGYTCRALAIGRCAKIPTMPRPSSCTHLEWTATRNALFAEVGVENEVAKAMNLIQHYYSELVNTVGNKCRNVAELIAAHLDGGSATSGERDIGRLCPSPVLDKPTTTAYGLPRT